MQPWVDGLSQRKKDPNIDALFVKLNGELDEGKRKAIFTEFQKYMWDNAVALKAGN